MGGFTGQKASPFDPEEVLVLQNLGARYVPEWDEQLHGCIEVTREVALEWPPKAGDAAELKTTYCAKCGVTWLCGAANERLAKDHPRHSTMTQSRIQPRDGRSIVVHIGAATTSGKGKGAGKAAIGVHFDCKSPHNLSALLPNSEERYTIQKAELTAVGCALETLRTDILPPFRAAVDRRYAKDEIRMQLQAKYVRMIVMTDSSYVVDGLCNLFGQWNVDEETGTLWSKLGKPIKNPKAFLKIREEVELLAKEGAQVVYYLVEKQCKKEAAAFANAAL